jgi:spore coat protein U-like protein
MKTRVAALFLIAFLGLAPAAHAQSCTFTMTDLDWGSIDLGSASHFDLTGTFTASCTGLSLLTVRVCPSIAAGSGGADASGNPRYLLQGSQQLSYNLFTDPARTTVWGSRFWAASPGPPTVDVPLNLLGSGSVSRTVYARVFSGQAGLPTGTYFTSFAGGESLAAYAYNLAGSCAAIGNTNATQFDFTASATRLGSCTVVASDLNFGSHAMLDADVDAATTISVNCTPDLSYSVGLNGGTQGATDPEQRQMANPSGTEFVTYGLYKDATHLQPWGSSGSALSSGVGSGSDQLLTAYGRVPTQATPSPDTYNDTVVVTVNY